MALQVKTNLDPKEVNDLLLTTFEKWLNFSLGLDKLGNRMLKAPSGIMASALRAEYGKDGNVVALWLDPEAKGTDINDFMISGHKRFSIKNKMLSGSGVRISKAGYRYRYIPIRSNSISPQSSFNKSNVKNLLTTQKTSFGGILGINKNLARMWTSNYSKASSGSVKIRTMSDKPGSSKWIIPACPVFSIGKLLKDTLPKNLRDRVIL